jgi:hypothetical protein
MASTTVLEVVADALQIVTFAIITINVSHVHVHMGSTLTEVVA